MMRMNGSIFFMVAIITVSYLSAQENSVRPETLEQRRQRVNEFVRQELEKGTSISKISGLLYDLVQKVDEDKVWKPKFDEWKAAREALQRYQEQYCQSCYEEYRSVASNPWGGRILASQRRDITEASNKISECKRKCSENDKECQNLEQKIEQVKCELDNAATHKWNTPEGKLYKQLSAINCEKIEIKIMARKVDEKEKDLQPLKSAKEKLEKKQEIMINELKAQLAQ